MIANLTADQRLGEVAAILAAAVVRLRLRAALPEADHSGADREKSLENEPNCLELPPHVRLTVHGG
jgi:hypothetical protein